MVGRESMPLMAEAVTLKKKKWGTSKCLYEMKKRNHQNVLVAEILHDVKQINFPHAYLAFLAEFIRIDKTTYTNVMHVGNLKALLEIEVNHHQLCRYQAC
ncbi:hypothetical protein L1987_86819 [Smallanthus sonchifolius]|uniref:Uncharacterized protein n=1 Tax=Smallanthus sonchifolius TaxID=185202 RepID=A0ACB8Y136_9ASTR|nr:hypothetical protein L1987_86819 [Smallanthus sonchifolius]